MTGIRLLQTEFIDALRNPAAKPPRGASSRDMPTSARRFNVYRNNVYAGLIGVIESRFPAVLNLVGDEFFKAMTRIFVDRAPPSSPVLIEYGDAFPDFVASFAPLADEPYLSDVASLEWRLHVARHAANSLALRPADLAVYLERDIHRLRFRFAPSVSLLQSPYPVFSLWRANTSAEPPREGTVFLGVESVLVTRPEFAPQAIRLPQGSGPFVAALLAGRTLGEAAEDCRLSSGGDFPLQRILGLLITERTIVSTSIGTHCEQELRS